MVQWGVVLLMTEYGYGLSIRDQAMITISIDRGGTFTDVYANIDGKEIIFKLLSVDPSNYKDAPTEGIRRVLEIARQTKIMKNEPLDLAGVDSIRMGTTVATNALLERKGARLALVVTKGYKDILRLGQQARPDIFDLRVRKLSQLYENVIEIDERLIELPSSDSTSDSETKYEVLTGVSGDKYAVEKAPNPDEIKEKLQEVRDKGIDSLAVALMHSYTCSEHEQEVAKIARDLRFSNVSISHELQPMIKLVSRANSATADAYLSPIIQSYLHTIANGFVGGIEALGSKLLFMQSDGGLASARQFSGLKSILSGPAGGVVGYAKTTYNGSKPVLGFDMGGTSTDVSRFDKNFEHVFETQTAQVVIQAPQLAIETVAAGGGSILSWRNGLYNVGPESASAHPGPACYRKGGPLTVTDANLVVGRIDLESFPHIFGPNENEGLDIETSRKKFAELAEEIARDTGATEPLAVESIALGFLDVANETMCRPIRSLSEGKGHTTSNHVLASFGGAAGQHAVAIAKNLGISEVVIHKYSSLLSAYGIALADVVVDLQQPISAELGKNSVTDLDSRLNTLETEVRLKFKDQGFIESSDHVVKVERYLNCRYVGSDSFMMIKQPHTLSSEFNAESLAQSFSADFVAKHRQEFGFTLERKILVGDVRVRAVFTTNIDEADLVPSELETKLSAPLAKRSKEIYFGDGWKESSLYKLSELPVNTIVKGPAMILDDTQTLVVDPSVEAEVHKAHVVLKLKDSTSNNSSENSSSIEETVETVDRVKLSVFGHRFMSIAEQMGHTLQKTSISVNIKERLDFSCAIFDPNGGLVANAPHIPVHLGSMSSAVAYQREFWKGKLRPGDVLMANHPAYGGSHLPDITVITPVFMPGSDTEIIFWAASRGHHSDIGGITAGSMPPFSKKLWQEGACIQGFKIVTEGKFDLAGLEKIMLEDPAKYPGCSGSRSFSDSVSDLTAQIAANNKGINLLQALANEFTLKTVQVYMRAIQKNAEDTVRQLLIDYAKKVGPPYSLSASDSLDDGTPICLEIRINPDTGDTVFDFHGTGPQSEGNLNAPKAITHSAILYCLRTMISQDIPLNQGCLNPLNIDIPDHTLLSPGPEAATVGGNVETSQRVTDTVFKAFRVVADSQGTCNNLTFGCEDFGYYETIGGGAGAGPGFDGQSGVQVHMTNTRSTDPEIFEKRYPVILREFGIRENSGGSGRWTGGDGIIRNIEFKRQVQLSILSERRDKAPNGLEGGANGKRGENLLIRKTEPTKPVNIGGKNTVQVQPGDRVVIQTPGGGGYGSV